MAEWFANIFGPEFSVHVWNVIIFVLITAVVGFLVKIFLQTVGRRLVAHTETDFDDEIFAIILPRVKWLTIIIAAYLAVEELARGVHVTETTNRQLILYAEGIIYLSFVTFLTGLAVRILSTMLRYAINRHAQGSSTALRTELFPLLNRILSILLVFIAGVIALNHFGVDVSSFLVFFGGGSVAVALAAQETLANMIAGFVIMFDKPFRIGDRINLPTGEAGIVYEIGLRSTKILDFDNNSIIIPNAELTKARVVNFSYPAPDVRVLVTLSVPYGTTIDHVKKIILTLAQQHADVLTEPSPAVFLTALNETSCELQLVARTAEWKNKFLVETTLREQIYTALQSAGIAPPYPHSVVHISPQSNADETSQSS